MDAMRSVMPAAILGRSARAAQAPPVAGKGDGLYPAAIMHMCGIERS
jgi:hypothetical protein